MRAITARRYGGPEVLAVEDVEEPRAADGRILVRVHASSLNAADWHLMLGVPYAVRLAFGLRRPRHPVIGRDYAGVVESVGRGVEGIQVGDRVLGEASQTFAELASVKPSQATRLPLSIPMDAAAALPLAGVTALQAVRRAAVGTGQRVLIVGAAGGVGSYATQIAASHGAVVTAVCSGANAEFVGTLGASDVIDYTRTDPTAAGRRFDAVLDIAGARRPAEFLPVLEPDGIYVSVGAPAASTRTQRILQPLPAMTAVAVTSMRQAPRMVTLTTRANSGLADLLDLVVAGAVRPPVENVIDLPGIPAAMAGIGGRHTRGKVVVRT
jgi:NADPH:quinone reductase-like Zn-dependent oxidoreductase